jgi:hypothetical protein
MRILNTALLPFLAFAVPALASPRIEPPSSSQAVVSPSPQDQPAQVPLTLPAPSRGQLLYDNHCMSCHESMVHIRNRQQVKSMQELRNQVTRWATYANLHWNKDEIEEVVRHLNTQFYKFER